MTDQRQYQQYEQMPQRQPRRRGVSPWLLALIPLALILGFAGGGGGGYFYGHRDVAGLQAQVATTQKQLHKTRADLKTANSDLDIAVRDRDSYSDDAATCRRAVKALTKMVSKTLDAASAAADGDFVSGSSLLSDAQALNEESANDQDLCVGLRPGEGTGS